MSALPPTKGDVSRTPLRPNQRGQRCGGQSRSRALHPSSPSLTLFLSLSHGMYVIPPSRSPHTYDFLGRADPDANANTWTAHGRTTPMQLLRYSTIASAAFASVSAAPNYSALSREGPTRGGARVARQASGSHPSYPAATTPQITRITDILTINLLTISPPCAWLALSSQ